MEFVLNFAWFFLAAALVALWLRWAPREGANRRLQFVSLLMLIVILLPAVSMTDDLLAAQNPAEVDSCLRRDHEYASPHFLFPYIAAPPLPVFRGNSLQLLGRVAVSAFPVPAADSPALWAIQNRPPPSA